MPHRLHATRPVYDIALNSPDGSPRARPGATRRTSVAEGHLRPGDRRRVPAARTPRGRRLRHPAPGRDLRTPPHPRPARAPRSRRSCWSVAVCTCSWHSERWWPPRRSSAARVRDPGQLPYSGDHRTLDSDRRRRPAAESRQRSAAYPGLITSLISSQPLLEVHERRLHRVDRDPLQVVEVPAERVDQRAHLAAHRGAAHQPVVGVHRDPEAQLGRAGRSGARRSSRRRRSGCWSAGTARAGSACRGRTARAGRAARSRRRRR